MLRVVFAVTGLYALVDTFDLAGTATLTFTGGWTFEATTAMLLRAGSIVSGNGGGYDASGVSCGR